MIILLGILLIVTSIIRRSQSVRIKNIGVSLVSLLVTLLVLELGVRWSEPHDMKFWGIGYPPGLHIEDKELRFKYRPNFSGNFESPRYAHIPIDINSLGFRENELDEEARQRLLFIGDSVTFGAGIEAEKRFTDLLEQKLNHETTEKTQVFSMGVNSYQADQELLMYERHLGKVPHDGIVVGFVLNDIGKGLKGKPPKETQRKQRQGLYAWWTQIDNQYRPSQMYLFRLIGVRLSIANHRPDNTSKNLLSRWSDSAALDALEEKVISFKQLTQQHQKSLLFVIFPHRHLLLSKQYLPQERLISLLKKHQISFVDMTTVFASHEDPESLFLYNDHYHFSEVGHDLVADRLYSYMK